MPSERENNRFADDIDALLAHKADVIGVRRGGNSSEVALLAEAFGELRKAYDRVVIPPLADPRVCGRRPGVARVLSISRRRLLSAGAAVATAALIAIVVWTLEPRGEHHARLVRSDQSQSTPPVDGSAGAGSTALDSPWNPSDEPELTRIQSPSLLLLHDPAHEPVVPTNVAKPGNVWFAAGGARLTPSRPPRFLLRGSIATDRPVKTKAPSLILERRSRTHVHDAHDRSDRSDPVGQSHVATSRFG